MSGGSFDYLCHKSGSDLFDYETQESLSKMAAALAETGYAEDAARETEELLCIVRQGIVRADVRAARLSRIWRAMEWWKSCDSEEDDLKEELEKYRKGGEK